MLGVSRVWLNGEEIGSIRRRHRGGRGRRAPAGIGGLVPPSAASERGSRCCELHAPRWIRAGPEWSTSWASRRRTGSQWRGAAVVLRGDLILFLPRWQGLGEIIEAARYAGILAAKQTARLIPLCHPIVVDSVLVEIRPSSHRFEVEAVAEIVERTGVEMEALTACARTALSLVSAFQDVDPSVSVEEFPRCGTRRVAAPVCGNRSDGGVGPTSGVSWANEKRVAVIGQHI